jgi:hypothetical protein
MKVLTIADCEMGIKDSTKKCNDKRIPEEERILAVAQIAVWERIKHHIINGAVITMDAEERVTLWPADETASTTMTKDT